MPTPTHTLWNAMPTRLALDILLAVQKSNKKLYRTAIEVMAPRMGMRIPKLLESPKVQRHSAWIPILARPEMEVLSFNILSSWLIETQRPMLCAWLDVLGIEHADNGCAETFPPQPDPAKLKEGVDLLLEKFDPVIVSVYLQSFNQIDETQWPMLDEILRNDARLQLKSPAPATS
ncbi:MAG TPA: hypothetical protein VL981_00085 [Candidatus Methylacidiphilales bacterium]|nr:hypothetical protein [Candidatus Methylacidiphilales bacterium]